MDSVNHLIRMDSALPYSFADSVELAAQLDALGQRLAEPRTYAAHLAAAEACGEGPCWSVTFCFSLVVNVSPYHYSYPFSKWPMELVRNEHVHQTA